MGEPMKTYREIVIKSVRVMLIIELFILSTGNYMVSLGFLIGFMLSVLSLLHIALGLMRINLFNAVTVKVYFFRRFLLRYIIITMALVLTANKSFTMFIGTVIGLLLIKFVILTDNIIVLIRSHKSLNTR